MEAAHLREQYQRQVRVLEWLLEQVQARHSHPLRTLTMVLGAVIWPVHSPLLYPDARAIWRRWRRQ